MKVGIDPIEADHLRGPLIPVAGEENARLYKRPQVSHKLARERLAGFLAVLGRAFLYQHEAGVQVERLTGEARKLVST